MSEKIETTYGEGVWDKEPAIELEHLTKSFGSATVLSDLHFNIPKGECTVVLGPSGTGKSVFLKNVLGLLKPTSGTVKVLGDELPKLNAKQMLEVRKQFGVLFQDGALFGSMSMFDNTAFPLREHTKKPEKEIKEIVEQKLEMVGLSDAMDLYPGEVSGGMKKRAGLARALVLDPEIVMFDEPDSGLDPVRVAYLNDLIVDLKKQLDSTFVVVTHNIPTARNISDYIGMLFRSNLVMFGPTEEMFNTDKPVVHQFLHGEVAGPIGMSEEGDAGDIGEGEQEALQAEEAPEAEEGADDEKETVTAG